MNQQERLDYLVTALWNETPNRAGNLPPSREERRRLLRALMNVRPAKPVSPAFLEIQDAFLQEEARERGIVDGAALPTVAAHPKLALWRGDITRLRCV